MEENNTNQNSLKCPYCGKEYLQIFPEQCSCGYYFNKAKYKEEEKEIEIEQYSQHYGVQGWLLFFCLSLTIFSPLYTIYNLSVSLEDFSTISNTYPGLANLIIADTIISICLTIFSIYAGIALWNIKPGAVRLAKTYLISFSVYIVISSIMPFMAGLPESANEAMMPEILVGAFRSFAYVIIWYSFLNVSKRVKATYVS